MASEREKVIAEIVEVRDAIKHPAFIRAKNFRLRGAPECVLKALGAGDEITAETLMMAAFGESERAAGRKAGIEDAANALANRGQQSSAAFIRTLMEGERQ